jgi:hypothetical protein
VVMGTRSFAKWVLALAVCCASTPDSDAADMARRRDSATPSPGNQTVERGEEKAVRRLVRSFMERRIAERGAEKLVVADARHRFRRLGRLGPMYFEPELQDFEIVFVDGPLGGPSYEVGVDLIFASGRYGHTYFVALHDGRYLISGGRPGLEGP